MKGSRRAGSSGASDRLPAALRTLTYVLASALGGVLAAAAFVSLRIARRVVTPATRLADTRILDIDVPAQTITLSPTPDTRLPGRYGLFTSGGESYLKIGTVLATSAAGVTRKLLTQVHPDAGLSPAAAFSGWYYSTPEELHLPFRRVEITTPVGACPAWEFLPEHPSDLWVIQIHGRGTSRAECLRAVPVFHARGIPSLLVSYRNDGDAPATGSYGLGATEWRDVDAALGWALEQGARRVILMGWSMGGAIALQVAVLSAHRAQICGIVLDSPVVDWRTVLNYQARLLHIPAAVAGLAMGALESDWARGATGADAVISFGDLDMVARAAELCQPTLILHSDDDGFVPSDASHALARARPDVVDLVSFDTARHTKLWNYDQDRWTRAIDDWLDRRGLVAPDTTSRVDA